MTNLSQSPNDIKTVSPESLPVIAHCGTRVVTTEVLAQLYGTDTNNIRQNHVRNAERFEAGKHYYKLEGADLREFKNRVTESHSVEMPRKSRSLILWTERGAARHAKMLDTDKAWEVFEKLEDAYFRVSDPGAPVLPSPFINPEQKSTLQQMVNDKVAAGAKHGAVWARFNNHFKIGSYKELPSGKFEEACEYLQQMEVKQKALTLPASNRYLLCQGETPQLVPVPDSAILLNPDDGKDLERLAMEQVPEYYLLPLAEACINRLEKNGTKMALVPEDKFESLMSWAVMAGQLFNKIFDDVEQIEKVTGRKWYGRPDSSPDQNHH